MIDNQSITELYMLITNDLKNSFKNSTRHLSLFQPTIVLNEPLEKLPKRICSQEFHYTHITIV